MLYSQYGNEADGCGFERDQIWKHEQRKQGKVQEARDLLALVYGLFTEGYDTRDLQEAKQCWRSWPPRSVG